MCQRGYELYAIVDWERELTGETGQDLVDSYKGLLGTEPTIDTGGYGEHCRLIGDIHILSRLL